MPTIGIICEYNPFHNGHSYHINKIKEMYPDSLIILVLNGYFLERGEISIISKEEKTKIALTAGVNLIVELPFVFGSQAADIFAENSIKLLNELKVGKIIFGSECNDIKVLEKFAKKQMNNKKLDSKVKSFLAEGINYPTALAKAINQKNNVSTPNDLLGISYIKAIIKNKFNIAYETIKRTNDYHDKKSIDNIISASNIREKLKNNVNIEKYVPNYSLKYIDNRNLNYFSLLKYKIITDKDLSKYLTVDEGIENRIKKAVLISNNLEELIQNIKTKRYTYNKINRMLIHILIGLTKDDNKKIKLDYIKILGFDNLGKSYLNKIKKDLNIPLFNKNIKSIVNDYEFKAALLYEIITAKNIIDYEKRNKPLY